MKKKTISRKSESKTQTNNFVWNDMTIMIVWHLRNGSFTKAWHILEIDLNEGGHKFRHSKFKYQVQNTKHKFNVEGCS